MIINLPIIRQSIRKKMLMVVNPISGKAMAKRFCFNFIRDFNEAGYTVTVFTTGCVSESNITFVAKNAVLYDVVVCCGGDGTLNEVVNGILKAKMASHRDIPIGYIPFGTTNDFAATMGIPTNPEKAEKLILSGNTQKNDIGMFGNKVFTYIAAAGAFTDVAYNTPTNIKNAFGHPAYVFTGIAGLHNIKPFHLRIVSGGTVHEDDYIYVSLSNTTSIGGVVKLDKRKVSLNDGVFELLLIKHPKNLAQTSELLSALVSSDMNCGAIKLSYTNSVSIVSASPIAWTLDGENGGKLYNVKAKILPRAVTFFC